MEFHIRFSGAAPAAEVIEEIIRTVDPAAMVDIEPGTDTLRIAASVDAVELAALVSQSGLAVAPSQVVRLPSICCGGCSG
jgi:hypothetical protein